MTPIRVTVTIAGTYREGDPPDWWTVEVAEVAAYDKRTEEWGHAPSAWEWSIADGIADALGVGQ